MLTPLQQFIQEKILLSVHPGCSIEEARERELKPGCFISCSAGTGTLVYHGEIDSRSAFADEGHRYMIGVVDVKRGFRIVRTKDKMPDVEIIGFPPTLSRVLTALGDEFFFDEGRIIKVNLRSTQKTQRKLLNEDGTDCNLFEQDESTQKAIAILFGWKDEKTL